MSRFWEACCCSYGVVTHVTPLNLVGKGACRLIVVYGEHAWKCWCVRRLKKAEKERLKEASGDVLDKEAKKKKKK